ncbi:hypothetical protein [Dyella sp.]|uniref:hypothetical protein n=1 Tax=Dyella sp. TaxID=1869338 RepID=UPI002B4832A0|nr:hypothetical protein [Dyella sp.]HKT28905.1 hypothetical protein [Dyella sp.]
MFAVACYTAAFDVIQLRWKAMLAGVLGTWLALHAISARQERRGTDGHAQARRRRRYRHHRQA